MIAGDNETRCYDELGCMTLGKGWYHLIYRPFNVFPLEREMINTRFILHTRKNPEDVSTQTPVLFFLPSPRSRFATQLTHSKAVLPGLLYFVSDR
jgi:hypothetical protein